MSKAIQPKDATIFTKALLEQAKKELPFENVADFENAIKGFMGTKDPLVIADEEKHINWNLKEYDFISTNDEAPESVHPSLWRKAQLNMNNGLYKVTDRVYQVRGFDLSNMTIIEGETGLIIIDTLISTETAAAALDLYFDYRPKKPIVCIMYTHSHVDHYGGAAGLVDKADILSGKIEVVAPEDFTFEAVVENVFAGNAMIRRSEYMYGAGLSRGVKGQVDAGLGKNTSKGTISLIEPTDIITKDHETRIIDGVKMEFLMVPHTEAPTEFVIYFPDFKMLNIAEIAVHTMHNILTLRGAQIRDSYKWWKDLDKVIAAFEDRYEICIGQHHWPTWGNAEISDFLKHQRDLYKYIHDQTLHFINKGYTATEIAESVKLPQGLEEKWYLRGHYGTLNHNIKAVYQFYIGWYSGHPSDLYPLPPEDVAKKYVEAMGGIERVMTIATTAFNDGDYRWGAELLKHAVFFDETNQEAKELLADTFEQLGYQSESGPWRNVFLTGAAELRGAKPQTITKGVNEDVLAGMPFDLLLDFLGIRLNSERASGKKLSMTWKLEDVSEEYSIEVENSVLVYRKGKTDKKVDLTLTTTREICNQLFSGSGNFKQFLESGKITCIGDMSILTEFISLLDNFDPVFNIVTP
ncbi:alkyl/aryl-sulfatase [Enterococcus rivorum]|uniref:Linear primary-alkylsulfatase n=1 Tax=Enterococcus rivorum TaxID=762845 RepID=A0A1E5KSP7_9ENTE|nr:alkyl sulfatase dimerization domain-containing protein [Enterococcus rivorum]MBP2098187.1 alkyl sulfatase BDS1-like metallo-beta-lactamase superfamily hydrolase [Enterococcus rivorum]OEH80891.1 alkyl sulfatase [Enterococcus rivorum]